MLRRGVAVGAVLTALAACAGGEPGSLCLFQCTTVIRTDSAGDDDIQQHRHIDYATRARALEWMKARKAQEAGQATTPSPLP